METSSREKIARLKRYVALGREIEQLSGELGRWFDIATRTSPAYSATPHSGRGEERIQKAIEERDRVSRKLSETINRMKRERLIIENSIEVVEDPTQRTLLRLRYIDGLTWEEVAEKIGFSYQWTCTLHGIAVQKIKLPPLDTT